MEQGIGVQYIRRAFSMIPKNLFPQSFTITNRNVSRESRIATYRHLTSPVVVSGSITTDTLRTFFISTLTILESGKHATKRA